MDRDSPNFQMHFDFVMTISSANLMNLGNFQPFVNKSELNSVDFLTIAREMKENIPLTTNSFTHVITEVKTSSALLSNDKLCIAILLQMGICQSSTKFYSFQNPYFRK